MNEAILVVDDEQVLARNLVRYLEQQGYAAQSAGSAAEALALLDSFRPDCALLDYNLPGMDGLRLMAALREREPELPVIILTGHGNVQLAVEAIKAGAQNYLAKPVALDEVRLAVAGVLRRERTEQALDYYKKRASPGGIETLVGDSESMRGVRSQLQQIVAAEAHLRDGTPPGRAHHRRNRDRQGTGRPRAALRRPTARAGPSSKSTARRCRRSCWSRNSSATSAGRSRTPSSARSAWSRRPTVARCFSTRSETSTRRPR